MSMFSKSLVIPLLLGVAFFPYQISSQEYMESGRKAVIHEHATAKQSGGQGLGVMSSDKCCTGLWNYLLEEKRKLSDCAWISSGDDSWKNDLSSDLDRVEGIEKRLQQLAGDDLKDPDAQDEKNRLLRERDTIEKREMSQLRKVAPLTTMCDKALDGTLEEKDSQTMQEARVDCVSLFVSIASGSCQWQPSTDKCISVARPTTRGDSSWWPTITVVALIVGILAVTYYVARPAAMAEQEERGEYSSLG